MTSNVTKTQCGFQLKSVLIFMQFYKTELKNLRVVNSSNSVCYTQRMFLTLSPLL